MLTKEQFDHLKKRAEMQVEKVGLFPTFSTNNIKIKEFLQEISLYQVELEIQNLDLIQSQLELEKLHGKYLEFYEHAPGGYFTLSHKGIVLEVNQAGADLLAATKQEITDRKFSNFVDKEFHVQFNTYLQNILNADAPTCEVKLKRNDGSHFFGLLYSKSMTSKVGKGCIWMFVTDINRRKQEYLRSLYTKQKNSCSEERVSIRKLNAVTANELTQPLTIIGNYLNGCISHMKNNTHTIEHLNKTINESIKQIKGTSGIALNLKNFTCKNQLKYESVCVKKLVLEAFSVLEDELSNSHIQIEFRIPKNLPLIIADEVYLKHVIISLARNSIDAMHDVDSHQPKIIVEVNPHANESLEVRIIDNGPGVNSEDLKHLFNPNFTTKHYGSGLSLALCRAIIEAHGGIVNAESNITSGISINFTLSLVTHR